VDAQERENIVSTCTPSYEAISFDPSSCSRDHLIFYLALTCGRDGADITEVRSHCGRIAAFDGAACARDNNAKARSRKVADFSDKIMRSNKCLERNHDSEAISL
jgi:hypothetical protein